MSIKLQIGSLVDATYNVFKTEAPVNYDGFGTITLKAFSNGPRYVAIHPEHQTWQINRYASGRFNASPVDTFDQYAERILVKRLMGEEK